MDEKRKVVINRNQIAVKPNMMINAKYKGNLLEQKIFTMAFSKVDQMKVERGGYKFSFSASELQEILELDNSSGSFYSRLKSAAQRMAGRTIGYEDDVTHTFVYHALITTAEYKDNVFSIYFNGNIDRDVLFDVSKNFTKLPMDVMMGFKNVYALRLYELLKSQCYSPKGAKVSNVYNIAFGLSELRFALGTANAETVEVRRILENTQNPTEEDYDKAYEIAFGRTNEDWSNFKRRVLEKAINEINDTPETGMQVSYTVKRAGYGGKIKRIMFQVEMLHAKVTKSDMLPESDEMIAFYDYVLETCLSHGISINVSEAKQIAEAADFDNFSVLSGVLACAGSTTEVKYPVAFIIRAIEEHYVASRSQLQKLKKEGHINFGKADVESIDESQDDFFAQERDGQYTFTPDFRINFVEVTEEIPVSAGSDTKAAAAKKSRKKANDTGNTAKAAKTAAAAPAAPDQVLDAAALQEYIDLRIEQAPAEKIADAYFRAFGKRM